MKYLINVFLITFLLSFGRLFPAYGQTKFEREYRIDLKHIPTQAVDFIDSCCAGNKIKWYAEESQDGKSIEAKTLLHRVKYSIEFDTLGNVLDVERTIKFQNLDENVKTKLSQVLKGQFKKFKISKTQIQWKGSNKALNEMIRTGATKLDHSIAYEIVLKGKKDGFSKPYEILIDSQGKVLKLLEIVHRPTDNLDF